MSQIVKFPGLGLEFHVNRVAFKIFGMPIYWYGILIATGLVLAVIYGFHKAAKQGIDTDKMMDVAIGGIIGGVVFARVYYVVFNLSAFDNFWQMLDIRDGGVALYGSVIGAALGAWLVARWRKFSTIIATGDIAAVGFLIGQTVGRWGNFINNEAFGTNTKLPWGMTSDAISNYLTYNTDFFTKHNITVDPSLPVHPCFLYESLWCLLGFIVLSWYINRKKFNGEVMLLYCTWYSFGRFFIEGLRTDSLYIGTFRVSQLLAALLFVGSIVAIVLIRRRIKAKGTAAPVPAGGAAPDGAKESAEAEKTAEEEPADPVETEIPDEAEEEENRDEENADGQNH